jgi:class 3 adenylate cyclase/tetratricopeptide (TPR) repeat protein
MICPNCQTENPDGARFCMSCGTALTHTCPNCGTSLPAGAKFCFNCGHNLAESSHTQAASTRPTLHPDKPAEHTSSLQQFIPKELLAKLEAAKASGGLEGERRIVTMLFCDVKGSTAAASNLDPEEWAEIINGAFEHMIHPIYRYEGTVARLMGDGLLAFFGAPIAHEDDPQRAVLAGLQILQEIQSYHQHVIEGWDINMEVRVGINTGLVVVGAVGSDLRMEYTALGDAINLAARMEQTAEPGTIQVTEATYKLIAPLFEFEALDSLEVKGKSEPVHAFRVLSQKKEPGRLRGIEGLDAPLIGRAAEMGKLKSLIAELRQGQGGIISILGEAGLGKSRLLAELRKSVLKDSGQPLSWLEGRSLSFETSTPYAPFIDLFTECLDLQRDLPDVEKYSELKTKISSVWPEGGIQISPFIATLLGIPPTAEDSERVKYLEPPILRSLVFAHTRAFFEKLAAKQPLVLVFEDLHWIDPTSMDLLESLLPVTDRLPIMVIAAFRSRRQDASWHIHEIAGRDFALRYTSIHLEPLNESDARELLGSLLHVEDLPEKVRRLIMERAEGNPFFVEELIRSLLDAGLVVRQEDHWRAASEIENISIPDTLTGVITTRLDRLEESTRHIVNAAAVIGRDFSFDVLSDLTGKPETLEAGLAELQRRELVREKSRLPYRTYIFKHILTQEAAYASILLSRRRELHGQVARSLQRRQPEGAADIARHFLGARQPAQAVPYLVTAGERAAHAYSNNEAIQYFTQALDLQEVITDKGLIQRAYEGLGSILTLANQIPQAIENYRVMLHTAEIQASVPMRVSALNKLAAVYAMRLGQFPEAEAYLAQADRLAREQQLKDDIVENSIIYCQICTTKADFVSLVPRMAEVVEIGRETDSKEHIATGLEHVAGGLLFLTRFDEAWEKAQQALKAAREIGNKEHESILLSQIIPLCLITMGKLDEARSAAEEGVQISTRIGALFPQIYSNWLLADIARLQGDYSRALVAGQRSLDAALPMEDFMPFIVVQPLGLLGTIYLEISRHFSDQIARFHQHAMKILESPIGAAGGGTAWADLGFCALALGDQELAEESFQKGLNYPTMFRLVERPRYLAGSALLALTRGDLVHATQLAGEARADAEARKMVHLQPMIALIAGRIQAACGELDLALADFDKAERTGMDMLMRPVIWQARAEAARVLSAAGRPAESQLKKQAAQAMVDEIASLFQEDELRSGFVNGALEMIG